MSDLDFFYPLLIRDEESSFSERCQIWGDIFFIQRNQNINSLCEVWLFARDMDIIIIESSLDDRLILRVGDDLLTERCKCIRDDIHDRVHTESCWTRDTDGEVCVGRHENI